MTMNDVISIKNAKVHNLKNISVDIPKNKLVVITGVSGSGKSSLAFDTLYAEGQRRYVESLSSYARQFLGLMEKPDVESITGLSPAISIDQKTTGSNPRSTVGTITEIYDYLRLLFGHVGTPHCPQCFEEVHSQTIQEITDQVNKLAKDDDKIVISSPVVQNQKGTFKDVLTNFLSKGFLRVNIDGTQYSLDEVENINLEKNIKHNISLIVDRISFKNDQDTLRRITDAIELSGNLADGEVNITIGDSVHFFSQNNTCRNCKISFPKIKPASFSFNSPYGACQTCSGIGTLKEINIDLIYNPKLSIKEGGIFPWSNMTTTDTWTLKSLEALSIQHGFSLSTQLGKLPKEIFDLIFFGKGAKTKYSISYTNRQGMKREYDTKYEGVIPQLQRRYLETDSEYIREEIGKYMIEKECSDCAGKRLKPYSLAVTIGKKNIDELVNMQIEKVFSFFNELKLEGNKAEIAKSVLKEIISRLRFLHNVGLTYLTLARKANTLSGGESQRIRLASQIGTGLTGVLYVLDEPSIGLHPKDVSKLIKSIEELRDLGNSVVVVEHDIETISKADWIIDVGPGAGVMGGKIEAEGDLKTFKQSNSLTAKYLNNTLSVGQDLIPKVLTTNSAKSIHIENITTHNLKNITVDIPLGMFVCVTGVSGSGKSSLINDTLYPALMNRIMKAKMTEGNFELIEGYSDIDKVIGIDQTPIGRTPRSNPATYTGVFTEIREIFSQTPESRSRGYSPSRFSFNVKGGRCEKCKGDGQIKIEMQFLPDVYVQCDECFGKRYNKEALQIDYKGKSISDILEMPVGEALEFFKSIPTIQRKLEVLQTVGLDYIKLGQSATTLSGGESQRIKLSKELSRSSRGHTMYILDEPTTGLHFQDVDKLLHILKKLVDKNNTVIVIEHNIDIIKHADHIIDIGPEGGDKGGKIIAQGTIEDIKKAKTYTGEYL